MERAQAEEVSGRSGARVVFRGRAGRIIGRWNDPWEQGPRFLVEFDDYAGRWGRLYSYRVLRLLPRGSER